MTETSEVRVQFRSPLILLLIGIVLTTAFLFPGDAPFVGDEPWLLSIADKANHQRVSFAGFICRSPLRRWHCLGRDVSYGPFPVWLDQIILIFTRNPIRMVVIQALLCGTANAIALLWLTRSMGISGWYAAAVDAFAVALDMGPALLGDNCLCIPLTAMAIAAYGDSLVYHGRWTLVVTIVCLMASTLCQACYIGMIAAVAVHLVYFQRDWVKRWRWTLIGTLGCFLVCVPC